jgi:glycosyltransferase involved in cell wall biosynthesis
VNRSPYSLSLIIPLYNEIEILEPNLIVIDRFLAQHFDDYEIVIIESGSTDGSAALCDQLAARLDHVKVVHEGARNGIGSATAMGFQRSTKELAWRYAIDLPCRLETILEALPLFAQYDCVLSYRSGDDRSGYRKFQSAVFNTIAKVVLGVRVRHINSAFKVFRTKHAQAMPFRAKTGFIDTEMVFWTFRHKLSWVEIPVPLTERTGGKSSVTLWEPVIWIRELFRLRLSAR